MSLEENKALVRRCIEEVFNNGNINALDEFLDPNVVHHSLPPGMPPNRESFKKFVSILLTAFPEFHIAIEDIIAEGNKVVGRATTSGTQKGDFMGIPASGKKATWGEIFIWRIESGKAVEMWAELDQMSMMQQLGALPEPGHK
jgi:steroid delta-isomerase-like uncharacterized protein